MIEDVVRAVVTGDDSDGRSGVIADGLIAARRLAGANTREFRLWGSDEVPLRVPAGGVAAHPETFFPPVGGVRVLVVQFDPWDGRPATADIDSVDPESRRVLESSGDVEGGFHRTDSVDIAFVLEGEVVARLDQGDTVLRAGDCLVQRGTNHSWENRASEPCTLAIVVVGAERRT
jgi:mannose-6-phosphate isomerase-like protein (cupin superfamily)